MKMSLSTKIFLFMGLGILAGLALNVFFPDAVANADKYVLIPVGKIFLKLIEFLVVPMVLFSLIVGMGSIGDPKKIGRYSFKLVVLYVLTAAIAVWIGIGFSALIEPGTGLAIADQKVNAKEGLPFIDWLLGSIPNNLFAALSSGSMLQVIVTAVLIGIGVVFAGEKGQKLYGVIESANHVTMSIMSFVMKLAPYGVFALIASVTATQGLDVLKNLSYYVLGLIVAIVAMALVYTLLLAVTGGQPLRFWKSFAPAFGMAFGTASSNATLPLAMENAKGSYGLSPEITSFALPFGTSLKKDGAAILQGFNAVFVAQLFGLDLGVSQYVAIFVSTIIVSFSTAGVPGAGIIMMSTVLTSAGLPLEGIALVAGIDRLTEGFRTALNVISNAANAVLLEKSEQRAQK